MKKNTLLAAVAVLTLIITAWSCAKEAESIAPQLSRESFDAWVRKYAPNAQAYKDIYIEYIERGPEGAARPAEDFSWMTVNYTGKLLSGTVFTTRVDSISRRVGRFSYTTHYVDDFLYFTQNSSKLCDGMRQAFEAMRTGDSVKIYIPQDKGFSGGMDLNSGYYGEGNVVYAGVPIMFEMRLASVTNRPGNEESDLVQQYAKRQWGSDFVMDTTGLYIHIAQRNPAGDTITKDSSVWVYYEQFFMDGFLCKTNVDTMAKKFKVYDDAQLEIYEPIVILPLSEPQAQTQKVLYLTVPNMRKGEIAEVVTVSTWSFGNNGNSSATPEILPYQPMVYRIHVLEKAPGDDDTEGATE